MFLDNIIYVTDPEQGQALQAEADARLVQRRRKANDAAQVAAAAAAKN